MDSITHEFVGHIRPYFDRPDIVVPVQWYRAPPQADFLPYVTAFGNLLGPWDDFTPYVGADFYFDPNWVGNFKGTLGTKPCGGKDAWANGVSFNDPAPPCKCEAEMLVPVEEVPSGLVDGTNRNFTLSQVPFSAQSLLLFLNGVCMTQGVDYNVSSQNIYMAALQTPRLTDNLLAYYWVQT